MDGTLYQGLSLIMYLKMRVLIFLFDNIWINLKAVVLKQTWMMETGIETKCRFVLHPQSSQRFITYQRRM